MQNLEIAQVNNFRYSDTETNFSDSKPTKNNAILCMGANSSVSGCRRNLWEFQRSGARPGAQGTRSASGQRRESRALAGYSLRVNISAVSIWFYILQGSHGAEAVLYQVPS